MNLEMVSESACLMGVFSSPLSPFLVNVEFSFMVPG